MSHPHHNDVLEFVQQNSQPFVTSGDVAAKFDEVTERTIRKRLNTLVDQGRLRCRNVGGKAKVWYEGQNAASDSSDSPASLSQ